MARALNLSPSQASRVVKRLLGQPYQGLIREERIARARNLLVTTDLPAGEIARRVGMKNEFHFNRAFKAALGLPPGKYRKKNSAN